ncbi:hypothetical protein BH24ACT19_BH24ACT19_03400 [soil metagenome]
MEAESPKTVHLGPGEGRAVWMTGEEELVTRKVSAEQTGGAYSLFEVEVGPGSGQAPHIQHREDECLYVLDGEFEFLDDDGGVERGGPGSVLYVPKGNLHRYGNMGETAGRLLLIHTPGGSHERFLEEAGEPATNGGASPVSEEPLEAERIAAIGVEYGMEIVPLPPLPPPKKGRTEEKMKRTRRCRRPGSYFRAAEILLVEDARAKPA